MVKTHRFVQLVSVNIESTINVLSVPEQDSSQRPMNTPAATAQCPCCHHDVQLRTAEAP